MSPPESRGLVTICGTKGSYKELSLYTGEPANPRDIARCMATLKTAFPNMGNGFFDVLSERVTSNKLTRERLRDSVNWILDNFKYKELTVADVIRYDKRARLYTYDEVSSMVTRGEAKFEDFEIREIGGVCYRVRKTELLGGISSIRR
jgi:hypothetical protein